MNSVAGAIDALNSNAQSMLVIHKFMLLARIQRAAKLGDVDAQRYVQLCELNVTEATRQ